ncbi:MAG TPA: hypothetical protein VMT87_04460 [Vicinamibacteria bacterium]|nr:hypothetical protein [Vicinamibacteria bacterium]
MAAFLLTLPLVTPKIRGADEIEYFSYLPSLVFDHDLDFGDEYRHFHDRDPEGLAGFKATFLDRREPATGRHINFGPVGSALLWSPFYLVAHAATLFARALGAGVPADGLSWPYQAAAGYASALYGFFGLLLARGTLVRFGGWADAAATPSVLALWLGTPVFYYMTVAPGFAHANSLFAVSLLVWAWLWARARADAATPRDWALVGLAGGLCGLIREQDALFLALPALWLAYEALRTGAWRRGLLRALALGAAAFLAMVPQLFVYRALTGRFGPSRLVTRKVSYGSPHFFEVLFDPAHGLYAWAPLLLLATAGLLLALWRRRDAVTALLALGLLLQVWINGALESWTQAGAFGSRRFVAATPLFAWGLAALLQAAPARLGRGPAAAVVALFAWWNVSLMVQFGLRLMDRQRLEWPEVAVNQFTAVPPRLARVAVLFFTDRERLVREAP